MNAQRRGHPHDDFLVAVAKGLLAHGWRPKHVAWFLNVPYRAVMGWHCGHCRKDIPPDYRLVDAMAIAVRRELSALGLEQHGPELRPGVEPPKD